ncbi:hypothetical protein BCR36DRAFT_410865 [Piromyces finnis]|uniref:DNA repair and recombination protein RAD54B n=1 Tax=Piromyces finnis TaxID=1754191 RepID=A0A1Y1VEX7_9FUNG|nr:hypothetical protein BCR36DRAFT_410865 [Piromyces finnis]|eukprot:ORX54329.1 hypothetical protein BCR36DRAFT_410865 [Piromyces finnis]
MRRSLAPSQRNKTLGSSLSKFKSPILKSTSTTNNGKGFQNPLLNKKSTSTNNISNLKTKILSANPTTTTNVDDLKENQVTEDNNNSNNNNSTTPLQPPAKKIKLASGNYKKPLFTKPTKLTINKNNTIAKTADTEVEGEEKSEKKLYYNVVWRKKTTKKNKTWEGDGILIVNGKSLLLKDEDGKDIAKGQDRNKSLEEGVTLYLGQKEFEIMSVLDEKQYTSGRCFLKLSDNTKSISTGMPSIHQNKFKCPLTAKNQVKKKEIVPVPKYSITGENALIMPRPTSEYCRIHNPRKRPIVDVVVDPLLTNVLRPHQREGITFLYECIMGMKNYNGNGCILADEMGLGKTIQTISLIWTLLKQTPFFGDKSIIQKALIICPASLVMNWKKEFNKWIGDERIKVMIVESKKDILTISLGRIYSVVIMGYEKLRSLYEDLSKVSFDIIICDEGHRLKSAQIKTALAIKSLNISKRIILSGTPIQNDMGEYYSMVDFVNPGILGSLQSFRKVFEIPIVESRQPRCSKAAKILGEERSNELIRITGMFILRRTAEINSKYLPPKEETIIFCRPTDIQIKMYTKILDSPIIRKCLSYYGSEDRDTTSHLQCIIALKKLCNTPLLVYRKYIENPEDPFYQDLDDYFKDHRLKIFTPEISGKFIVLMKLLESIHTQTNEKVVLISNYTQTLDIYEEMCKIKKYTFLRLDGKTPSHKRQEYIDIFNNNKNYFLFLLSSKSGGQGLNLVGASRLILFDIDWNPSVDIQAMARIWRDGQKRKVYIYRLLTSGTIEESIYQRQITKVSLSDNLIDDKNSTNKFTIDELKDLFTFHDSKCYTHDLLNCKCENGSDMNIYPENGNNNFDNDDDNDSLDGFIVHDSEEEEEEEEEKIKKNSQQSKEIVHAAKEDEDDEGNIDDLLNFDDNDENNTDFLEVGSFQTEPHLGSSIFSNKLKADIKRNLKSPSKKEILKENKKDKNKLSKKEAPATTVRHQHHHMDELKNEWLHYIIDPIQLKPFSNKIQEIESNLSQEEENEKDFKNKNTQTFSSLKTKKIAQILLQDSSFDLPFKTLNDNILKTMIVEEGIDSLNNRIEKSGKGEEKDMENAIEFIFTREFKN